jgi:hypothetical protein
MHVYRPWKCDHDKPLDVLRLAEEPCVEWCMECGSIRRDVLDDDDNWVRGAWSPPFSHARLASQ